MNTPITITAVWLRTTGGENSGDVEVLVEIDGKWRLAIRDSTFGEISHIAEGNGVYKWPLADFGFVPEKQA